MSDPIPRSLLNPTDLAGMKQEGMGQGGTVRDFLQKMGIDVDGPVDQLAKFAQGQMQNASAMGKMQTMGRSQAMGGGMPPAGGRPPSAPPSAPPMQGMEGLLGNMR